MMINDSSTLRIGQIVPSSNVTMETEVPKILLDRQSIYPEQFTFHSARMRMKKVTKEELQAMDRQSVECAHSLADARVDVISYACLVAIMSAGNGYHRESEQKLTKEIAAQGHECPVVTSAGALIEVLQEMNCRRVSMITPYMQPLTNLVSSYVESEGIEVGHAIALQIEDNLVVGARDPMALLDDIERLDVEGSDAVVLSACVQMPSLAAVERAQDRLGLPVVTAATCTARVLLERLGLDPVSIGAGFALSPDFRPVR